MATKNENYEDLLWRLSNHINNIHLILDIVDVKSFPGGSRLQDVIVQQFVELRGRIRDIPAANVDRVCGVPDPEYRFSKNVTKIAPSDPKQLSPLDLGRQILRKMGEAKNFEVDVDNTFFCLLCERSMHSASLLEHIVGKGHKRHFPKEESEVDEGEYNYGNSLNDSHYDPVFAMIEEMDNCDYERSVELMWDIVYATDCTINNIEPNGKWFYCRLCNKTLNGPFPVVDHVRSNTHRKR